MATQILYVWDFTLSYSEDYNHTNLCELFSNIDIFKKYSFQGEEGDNTGYRHYQGRFNLKKKKRLKQVLEIFEAYPGIHLSPTSGANKSNMFYVTKQDTRIDGPWRDPEDTLYIPKQFRNKTLYPWQEKVIEISKIFNDRQVNLIYDKKGNSGKSTLASICELQYNCIDMPPINDMKELVQVAHGICKGKNLRDPMAFFMDMPRAMDKSKLHGIYTAIEQIKKGKLYDVRYKYEDWWIDSPAIWVFSNIQPDQELLSRDRWKIWNIKGKELVAHKVFNQYGTSDF